MIYFIDVCVFVMFVTRVGIMLKLNPTKTEFFNAGTSQGLQKLPSSAVLKGCGMGPWLVLVSPCFRENVVATCKIGSFLCSLDNLLQKNVIVLFFGNQISKWRLFEKRTIFTYFSHFLVTRESYKNFFSTYLKHIHTRILLTLLTFFGLPILKKKYKFIKYGFSLV